ncbi:hypothetical protein LIA77_04883 [Sarocladium implicatum]|nr:hypothetical protein LIA77_04883 [Sarocladium implicatum]
MDIIPDLNALPIDGKVHRHFPIDAARNQDRRRNYKALIRQAAKHYVTTGQQDILCTKALGSVCTEEKYSKADKQSRAHLEYDIFDYMYHTQPYLGGSHIDGPQGRRTRRWCRPRGRPGIEEEDSVHLARSEVPFPSDHDRTIRSVRARSSSDDAEVAELYRMGLLYDEDEGSKTLNLNSIRRDEPAYTIRPAKRARRSGNSQAYISRPLNLDLSFADLGDDDAIARYLDASSATTPSEITAAHDEAIQHLAAQRSNSGSPPLRVIYELDSLQPSFDVDTSQPPDLMDDSLSDYDCFSDIELEEGNSRQREVQESGAAEAWVMLD